MINQSGIIVSESLKSSLAPSVVEPVCRDQQLDGASVADIYNIYIAWKAVQYRAGTLHCFVASLPRLFMLHLSLEQSSVQRLQAQHRATNIWNREMKYGKAYK